MDAEAWIVWSSVHIVASEMARHGGYFRADLSVAVSCKCAGNGTFKDVCLLSLPDCAVKHRRKSDRDDFKEEDIAVLSRVVLLSLKGRSSID